MGDWSLLLMAVGIMLIFEGILPFVSPQRWKKTLRWIAQFSDRQMRIAGLLSMAAGLLLIFGSK